MNYYLALGSNIDDKISYLQNACACLEKTGTILKKSMVYKSKAYGYTEQDFFLNAVIIFQSDFKPDQLLSELKSIEKKIGRKETFRWGPREIDIDIVDYEGTPINEANLYIPHKEMEKRKFVLLPLKDVSAGYVTRHGKTIDALLSNCKDSGKIEIFMRNW